LQFFKKILDNRTKGGYNIDCEYLDMRYPKIEEADEDEE
jgi:hypothetical protein